MTPGRLRSSTCAVALLALTRRASALFEPMRDHPGHLLDRVQIEDPLG